MKPITAYIKSKNEIALKADKAVVDSLASGSPKGVYATVSALQTAFPTGNNNIYLVNGNIKEAASLNVTAIPTTAGNVTITLNGVATNIAVDPATDTTTDLVATKIRNTVFPNGAVTGGTGSTVTFTASTGGAKTDATYSAGTTGATGTMTTTTQGVDTDGKWYYWSGSAWTAGGLYQSTGIPESVSTDINGIKNDLYTNYKDIIQADYTILQNVSLVAETGGYRPTRTDTTKSYGWAAIDSSYNDITWEFDGSGAWFVIGASGSGSTGVGIKSGVMARVLEFTSVSTAYTNLKTADGTIPIPNTGDIIKISVSNKVISFKIKRVGQTVFADWFSIDMNSYPGATAFHANPVFGVMDISGEKSMFKNAFLGAGSSLGLKDEVATLKSQVNGEGIASQWKNKKWDVMGDSFTARNKYQITVQGILGIATVNSYGIGGTKIANTGAMVDSLVDRYTSLDVTADLVTVWGGVNDFMDSVPLGTTADTAKTTFKGALRVLIEGLINRFPTKKIAFITPTQMNQTHTGLTYQKTANSLSLTLKDYSEAIKEMCAIYSIPCLDMYTSSGLNDVNIVPLTEDGLHPNTDGFTFLSNKMAKFLDSI